jgi:hypothetical protein
MAAKEISVFIHIFKEKKEREKRDKWGDHEMLDI